MEVKDFIVREASFEQAMDFFSDMVRQNTATCAIVIDGQVRDCFGEIVVTRCYYNGRVVFYLNGHWVGEYLHAADCQLWGQLLLSPLFREYELEAVFVVSKELTSAGSSLWRDGQLSHNEQSHCLADWLIKF